MKKYFADALTVARFIAAVTLIVLTIQDFRPEYALWVFVAGELTDAFDGICARRWPFPEGQAPAYRRFAELYDMVSDVFLGLSALAYILIRVSIVSGLWITGATLGLGLIIEFIVWGMPFGSPDRHTARCLWVTNQPLAKTTVLLRRKFYAVAIGTVIANLLFASDYSIFLKISLVGAGIAIALVLVIIKHDRITEVKTK